MKGKTRAEWLQGIVRQYREEGGDWPANTRTIARWAIEKRLWAPHPAQVKGARLGGRAPARDRR